MIDSRLAVDTYRDIDGVLQVVDPVPFEVRRVFWIQQVPVGVVRGMHAHRTCTQAVYCVRGRVVVSLESRPGDGLVTHNLGPGEGVLIRAGTWLELGGWARETVALVLASEAYSAQEVIDEYREWEEYYHGAHSAGS